MSAIPPRIRIGAFVLLAWIGLASGVATLGQNPPAPAAPVADPAKPAVTLTPYQIPASRCKDCHSKEPDTTNAANRVCRLNEYKTWDNLDKHKKAYEVLTKQRATDMAAALGFDVTKNESCTNCHGTKVAGAKKLEQDPFSEVENGVSCVACHGGYFEWVKDHPYPEVSNWPKLTREDKENRYGMTDLWNPITRAAKCASCHIGNADERKVVTHDMYAAGHPPLPSFEVATFSEAQPKHWQYLRDKNAVNKKRLAFKEGKREQTELVVASGIVALREAMRLYAKEAGDPKVQKDLETHWPDFARFDCSACHHDLKVPSWRQQRGYAGRAPGRATTPVWPDVLVELGVTVANAMGANVSLSDYKVALEAFQNDTTRRPFGDPDRSVAAATRLADWADRVGKELNKGFADPAKIAIDDAMAERLLHQLGHMAATRPLDFDTARQIAWAFQIIYEETAAMHPGAPKNAQTESDIKALFKASNLPLPGAGTQSLIATTLDERLRALAEFDPGVFRDQFAVLMQHLQAVPPPPH